MGAYVDGKLGAGDHAQLTDLDYPSSAHTGFANFHGFVNWTDSLMTWNDLTRTFTIAPTSTSYTYYYQGEQVNVSTSMSVTIPNTQGLWWYYFDANGVLTASQSTPSYFTTVVMASSWWTGTAGWIKEERHHYDRNVEWHVWAHNTIGCRYSSGLNLTYSGTGESTTWATTPGIIYDEDNLFPVPSSQNFDSPNQARVMYQTGSTTFTFQTPLSLQPFLWDYTNNAPQYVQSGTYALTDLASGYYINSYMYVTEDYNKASNGNGDCITLLVETVSSPYTSVVEAEAAEIPNLLPFALNPEMKLLYRIVVDWTGTIQSVVDLRTQSYFVSGGYFIPGADAISFIPYSFLTAVDVQDAIEQIVNQFAAIDILAYDEMATTLLYGGNLSINGGDDTKFDLAAGGAVIIDNTTDGSNPIHTIVTWNTTTGITDPYLATADTVYIGINAAGVLQFSPTTAFTDTQRRSIATLGWVDHVNRVYIESAKMEPATSVAIGSVMQDFFYSFGAFNITGNNYSYSSGLTIQRSAGTVFAPNQNYGIARTDPCVVANSAENPTSSISYYYRTGSGTWYNNNPTVSVIDPSHYDNGTGTLASVTSGQWTVQLITYYALWDQTDIQYGQTTYVSEAAALSALQSQPSINPYNSVDVFRCWLAVNGGATDLTTSSQAVFTNAGKFGNIGAAGSTGAGGEVNTASNIGTSGYGLYVTKVGVNLEFANITGGSSQTITVFQNTSGNNVNIDVSPVTTLSGAGTTTVPSTAAVVSGLSQKINTTLSIAYSIALG